ncbi:MAG TPA: HAMP domain-containing sensor histidine kinase [Methanofastidiosum sp.]|nr:HAMP domain-containing sensor histidine kinase [Methanofastidiosum sp.]HNU61572.1 HAMP domain-containing sensor histidine kinase [Methanofastidiosum sp.]HOI77161.1 HAMP domain-containing sensor histidine kinase [Methanofastidiosum sp.]
MTKKNLNVLVFSIISFFIVLLWFIAFPIDTSFNGGKLLFEGTYLFLVVVMLFHVLKLNIRTFTFGWAMFSYGLLVDFLDEFTIESELFNTYLEGILISIGLFIVVFGFFKSVTIEKRETDEIKDLNNTLKLLNKILRHDILNNISVTLMSLEMLNTKDTKLKDKAIKAMNKSVDLINKVREFENDISSDNDISTYNLKEIIDEVVKNYDVNINLHGNFKIKVKNTFSSVIDNIIRNAVVHGKADKIDIYFSKKGDYEIKIVDNGRGIPDDNKQKVFDENFSSGENKGTGLGLYIVKELLKRSNGEIKVEDNKPKGTIFTISIKSDNIK